jgi:hypothetical protein
MRMSHEHSPLITRGQFLQSGATTLGAAALAAVLPAEAVSAEAGQRDDLVRSAPGAPIRVDLREFVQWITDSFEPSVRLAGGAGRYARKPGESSPELYGVSDMACVLYTIDRLYPTEKERAEWAEVFQSFQTGPNGMLLEKSPTHSPLHNTAFALAAMELLNLRPQHPVTLLPEHRDPRAFLEGIDWEKGVYPGSHRGAGIGAVCALVPELRDPRWFESYFAACEALIDPRNGMMGRNKPAQGDFDQIGGTFHYAFLFSHFNRLMPYPEQRIDAILRLQQPDGYWSADNRLWLTFDAMYLLTRTARYCTHRFPEVIGLVRRVTELLARDVFSPEGRAKAFSGKLPVHALTAAVSAAAEAQIFLGHREVISERPLRLILDRRPFI